MKLKLVVALAALLGLPEFTCAQVVPATSSASGNSSGWLAGAQAGYNWQSGSVVYGLETDIAGTRLKTNLSATIPTFGVPLPTATTTSKTDWYGTARGRLGWAVGPVLFYGTGGLAYGQLSINSSIIDPNQGTSQTVQSSSLKTGWVVGAGVDYLFRPNLILNLSYQYVDLGATSLVANGGNIGQFVNARGRFQEASVGVSWLFDPPAPAVNRIPYKAKPAVVTALPWQGFYAGGHAGDGWAERTDGAYSDAFFGVSDIRLKRDVVLVGRRDDGLGLYSYRYLWSDTVYVGVMAQEVALVHPDAVVRGLLDDYLRVDYRRLGSRLMTFSEWKSNSHDRSFYHLNLVAQN